MNEDKQGFARLILAIAENVSKDPESAKDYIAFETYVAELKKLAAEASGIHVDDVKINEEAAREYFDSGFPAYYCFREEFL